MRKCFFDYDNGDYAHSISDKMAMGVALCELHIICRRRR